METQSLGQTTNPVLWNKSYYFGIIFFGTAITIMFITVKFLKYRNAWCEETPLFYVEYLYILNS